MVFVRDPAATRSAVAKEEGTTILAIGGTPGKACRLSVGEAMHDMWDPYRAEDFEGALEALQPVLEERPGARPLQRRLHGRGSVAPTTQSAICSRRSRDDDRIKEHPHRRGTWNSLRDDPALQGAHWIGGSRAAAAESLRRREAGRARARAAACARRSGRRTAATSTALWHHPLVRHQRVPGTERGRRHPRARRDTARRGRAGGALHRLQRHGEAFEIDGDAVEAPAGSLVLVQPTAKRKATAKDDGDDPRDRRDAGQGVRAGAGGGC